MKPPIKIAILGATGSVGSSLIKIIDQNPNLIDVQSLSANKNLDLLASLANRLKPKKLCVAAGMAERLLAKLTDKTIIIYEGEPGLVELANDKQVDLLFLLVAGVHGIKALFAALKRGIRVGLSNKESVILGGKLINQLLATYRGQIIPIDSEHNALYQCLSARRLSDVNRLILTASGGPFLNYPRNSFPKITPRQALKHPMWEMGSKISIDSATMMNKCLEIIEAHYLFKFPVAQISAIVHPQSVVHGIVEFKEGSSLALMGQPDMRLPLSHCLGIGGDDINSGVPFMDLTKLGRLEFFEIDTKKFPTINLAYEVLTLGEGAPAYLNGVNQELVEEFLQDKISFTDIFKILQISVERVKYFFHNLSKAPQFLVNQQTLDDALAANFYGQEFVSKLFKSKKTIF
ncbi:MAG: 1-deoxy-D-xylulose-5-phosphate reductoisomerase [SAR324 cluster bacterium]|nr:1-deoxy-D-xylulose-5-phosphate reductoisomerase [SAR324 cluster bacterium]